uniref:Uncharacterized protein n=1 Tax=Anopheles culicifacies TaxID=139723 RepID=A0A182M353_9DIPT
MPKLDYDVKEQLEEKQTITTTISDGKMAKAKEKTKENVQRAILALIILIFIQPVPANHSSGFSVFVAFVPLLLPLPIVEVFRFAPRKADLSFLLQPERTFQPKCCGRITATGRADITTMFFSKQASKQGKGNTKNHIETLKNGLRSRAKEKQIVTRSPDFPTWPHSRTPFGLAGRTGRKHTSECVSKMGRVHAIITAVWSQNWVFDWVTTKQTLYSYEPRRGLQGPGQPGKTSVLEPEKCLLDIKSDRAIDTVLGDGI